MTRGDLKTMYAKWKTAYLCRQTAGLIATWIDLHSRWVERPNLYVELDMGNKNVRYPDGRLRSIRTRRVRDTAGVTFLAFDSATSLS